MLHGAIAAALTPLRAADGTRRGRDRAVRRLPRLARARRRPRARHHGRGRALRPRRAAARSPSCSWRPRAHGSRSPCTAARSRLPTPPRSPSTRRRSGADAVAVIAPPYFALDADELFAHFAAAAAACAPLPFYIYEFAARSGYAIPLAVIAAPARRGAEPRRPEGLGHAVGEVRAVPLEGLDIFVGPEALIPQGLAAGRPAPCPVLRRLPGRGRSARPRADAGGRRRAPALRASLQRFPFHAAAKMVLGLRGVPVSGGGARRRFAV